MGKSGRNLPATMIEVRKDVVAATSGRQVPWDHSALTGDFFFVAAAASQQPGSIATAPVGSSVDLAALQDRLRKLEDDAKRRASAATQLPPQSIGTVTPPAAPGQAASVATQYQLESVRIAGLLLSEMRHPNQASCQLSCEQTPNCIAYQHGRRSPMMGQCHLFARVDSREADDNWRAGFRPTAAPTDSVAAGAPPRLPATFTQAPSRRERGFTIYEGQSIIGSQIKMSATDSVAGCINVCRNTEGCTAAAYNAFFRGKNVACTVFREISDVIATPTGTMIVRGE
jgi:hypothetical protein